MSCCCAYLGVCVHIGAGGAIIAGVGSYDVAAARSAGHDDVVGVGILRIGEVCQREDACKSYDLHHAAAQIAEHTCRVLKVRTGFQA